MGKCKHCKKECACRWCVDCYYEFHESKESLMIEEDVKDEGNYKTTG